jgi:hypothetical protein
VILSFEQQVDSGRRDLKVVNTQFTKRSGQLRPREIICWSTPLISKPPEREGRPEPADNARGAQANGIKNWAFAWVLGKAAE